MRTVALPGWLFCGLTFCLLLQSLPHTAWAETAVESPDAEEEQDEASVADELEGTGLSQLRGAERADRLKTLLSSPKVEDVRDLCSILKDDLDGPETEKRAFSILTGFGGERLIPGGKYLLQQPIPYKKAMGIQLLAASKSKKVLPVLLEAASNGPLDEEVRFQLTRAFGYFGDPQAAPQLRTWAESDRFARLALGMVGDFARFKETLADHDETHFLLEQLAVAWAWAWNTVWTTPRQRKKAVDDWYQHREFIRMFEVMLGRMGQEQVRELITFMRANPRSHVSGSLYGSMSRLVTAQNAAVFLLLLDAPVPEVQEAAARSIAGTGDEALKIKLRETLKGKLSSPSWQERAVLVQVADLFPEPEGGELLRCGLRDQSAFVVTEALTTIRNLRVEGMRDEIEGLRGSGLWRSDAYLQRRAAEALVAISH